MTTDELPNTRRIAAYWALMPTHPPDSWRVALERCAENIAVCCDLLEARYDLEAIEEGLPADLDGDDFEFGRFQPGPHDMVNLWWRSEHFLKALEMGTAGLSFSLTEMSKELDVLHKLHFECAPKARPEHPLDPVMIVMGHGDAVLAARNREPQ